MRERGESVDVEGRRDQRDLETLQLAPARHQTSQHRPRHPRQLHRAESLEVLGHIEHVLPGLVAVLDEHHLPEVQAGGLGSVEEPDESLPVVDPGVLETDRPPETEIQWQHYNPDIPALTDLWFTAISLHIRQTELAASLSLTERYLNTWIMVV